jgi:type IV secretory pathway VirB9-like protein
LAVTIIAGHTVRWIIGDTQSGTGAAKRVHILLKTTRPDLVTNLIIDTDRRTYHLELRSDDKTYMAAAILNGLGAVCGVMVRAFFRGRGEALTR